jgi:hypothetical protein
MEGLDLDFLGMFMVRPERFERPTYWFVASCSIQLSYGRTLRGIQLYKDSGDSGLGQPPGVDRWWARWHDFPRFSALSSEDGYEHRRPKEIES